MWPFRLLVIILAIEIVYLAIPSDELQLVLELPVAQVQLALGMVAALLGQSFRRPVAKLSLMIGTVWAVTVALTDWIIPREYFWVATMVPVGFLAWLLVTRWRYDRT